MNQKTLAVHSASTAASSVTLYRKPGFRQRHPACGLSIILLYHQSLLHLSTLFWLNTLYPGEKDRPVVLG